MQDNYARREQDRKDFVGLPENVAALEIFLMCQTHWRYSTSAILGLDYTPLLKTISLYYKKRKRKKAIFADIQSIEQGAMTAIRKLKKDKNG